MLPRNMRISDTSSLMSTDQRLIGTMYTCSCGSMTTEYASVLKRYYLRLGRLAIRMHAWSTAPEVEVMQRNILTALLIYLRFISTRVSVKDANSVNLRLSGLCRHWTKKYDTMSIESLCTELFGTKGLQHTLLYRLCGLLRIDCSRSVQNIAKDLILIELAYIDRVKSYLPQTSKSSENLLRIYNGYPIVKSATNQNPLSQDISQTSN